MYTAAAMDCGRRFSWGGHRSCVSGSHARPIEHSCMRDLMIEDSPVRLNEHQDCGTCPLAESGADSLLDRDLSRRSFVSAAMLTAIAAALAACGGGQLSAADKLLAPSSTPTSTPTPTPPATPVATGTPTVGANQFGVTVANYPALAAVGGIAVVRTSPAIALTRTATGFVAFSLRCPHEGTTVNVLSNSTLRCPNHGATFASSGSWSGGYRTGSLSARGVTSSADKTFVVVNLS